MSLKPYPAYKDSGVPWVDARPTHWGVRRNKTLLREVNVQSGDGVGDLLSVSQYTGVSRRRQEPLGPGELLTRAASLVGYKEVEPGDLVMNIMLAWNGSLGVSTLRGLVSPAYCVFRSGPETVPRFLHYLYRTPIFTSTFRASSTGVVDSRLRLYPDVFLRLSTLVPPLPEQLAIVRYLDYMDRRIGRYIRAKRRLIALLNEQKQATIQRAVTRGLDPAVRLKPSGVEWLGDVPEHWEVVPLSATAESIQTGPFGSQLHSGDYVTGGTPVVNPSHLVGGCILPDPRVTVDSVTSERLGRHRLHEGDIVMPRRGELGRCAAVTRDQEGWLCGTGSIRVRPKASVFAPDYLVQLLSSQTMRYALKMYSIGTTMDNLSAGIVARLRLPCPPLEEQNRIVHSTRSVVAAISSTIVLAQRQIDLLRAYRTRLIADVVTGKLDVREAAAHLPDEVDEQEPPDEEEVLDSAGDDMDVVDIMEDAEEFVA